MTKPQILTPKISTGGRSVFLKGRNPAPFIFALLLPVAIAFTVAIADHRPGFKLFMAGAGSTLLVIVIALYLRSRALRTGEIRISKSGELRFTPPRLIRIGAAVVAFTFLIPAVTLLIINALDLPTQQGYTRFTTVLPYLLALFGLWSLARIIWSMKTPAGLLITPQGLQGVRGSTRLNFNWDELVSATPFGKHGPKLMLITTHQGVIFIDSHHTGSDPAIVALVIEYFKANPAYRAQLSDGVGAILAVEAAGLSKHQR